VALDMNKRWAVLNAVINLRVPQNARNFFLATVVIISFTKVTIFYGEFLIN
jgi:hypothetical protein